MRYLNKKTINKLALYLIIINKTINIYKQMANKMSSRAMPGWTASLFINARRLRALQIQTRSFSSTSPIWSLYVRALHTLFTHFSPAFYFLQLLCTFFRTIKITSLTLYASRRVYCRPQALWWYKWPVVGARQRALCIVKRSLPEPQSRQPPQTRSAHHRSVASVS